MEGQDTPLKGCPSVQDGSFDLMTFEEKLATIHSLDVLYGFANRRKVLGVDLPKWTEDEVRMILARKYQLEKESKR